MKKITLKVEGMVCNGCENRVKNALKTIEGIEKVEASYKKETVIVRAKDEIQEESIKEKIEDIGFSVK